MEPNELEYFRNKLEDLRAHLSDESEATLHEMQSESTLYPDPTDRASLETDRNTVLRIRDRERKLLSKVLDALERIENGTFGDCESCGDPIGSKRLEARPVTTLCINCKEEMEEEEHRKRVN